MDTTNVSVDSSLKNLYDTLFSTDSPQDEDEWDESDDVDEGDVKFDQPVENVIRNDRGKLVISKEVTYNEKDIEARATKYTESCVHDYPDSMYHLSDEEILAQDKYMGQYMKIISSKTKINNLADFIKVYREVYKFVEMIASDNLIFSKEEFIEKFLEGEIKIPSIPKIKYTGKAKNIDWNEIQNFCIHPDMEIPISFFKKSKQSEILDDIDERNEDKQEIIDANLRQCMEQVTVDQDEIYADVKPMPSLVKMLREASKKAYKLPEDRVHYAYDIHQNDMDEINAIDRKRRYKGAAVPKFTGNLMDDDDYYRYIYELDEWEDEFVYAKSSTSRNPVTKGEEYMNNLKRILEDAGYKVRKMKAYSEKNTRKELKKKRKKALKKEGKLKEKLISMYETDQEYEKALRGKKKKKKKKKDEVDMRYGKYGKDNQDLPFQNTGVFSSGAFSKD